MHSTSSYIFYIAVKFTHIETVYTQQVKPDGFAETLLDDMRMVKEPTEDQTPTGGCIDAGVSSLDLAAGRAELAANADVCMKATGLNVAGVEDLEDEDRYSVE